MKHAPELLTDISPAQRRQLDAFASLLRDVAVPRGFVGAADRDEVRSRHIADSARAARLVPSGRVADLGSGAGLPGIVVAILRPDVRVHLVESMRRRQAFLELAIERVGVTNATAVAARAERLPPDSYDGALARAFAPLEAAWAVASRILREGGRLVYFAGRRFDGRAPVGADASVVPPGPGLESAGPLVIMTRR